MRAAIIILGLSVVLSAHAQGPAGAGASRDADAEKSRQQKAAADYCIAHPLDTDKCIFLPPGVSSEFPSGLPPMPKPTGLAIPSAQLTEEQKQKLNGTYRPPQINIPTADPVTTSSPKPITLDASPVVPSYSPTSVNTPSGPQPTYQPSCDAACIQARKQENYQAGYAVGQLIGAVIERSVAGAVNIQRRNKFCKDHPTGSWNFANGSSATCASINGEHSVKAYSKSPEVQAQFRTDADRAHDVMEDIRHNVTELQGEHANVPGAQSMLQQSRTDWLKLRKMFCAYYLKGEYTDLDGKQQTCSGWH